MYVSTGQSLIFFVQDGKGNLSVFFGFGADGIWYPFFFYFIDGVYFNVFNQLWELLEKVFSFLNGVLPVRSVFIAQGLILIKESVQLKILMHSIEMLLEGFIVVLNTFKWAWGVSADVLCAADHCLWSISKWSDY